MKFCPNCGFGNDENNAFCKNCGTKLSSSQPAGAEDAAYAAAQPQTQPPISPATPPAPAMNTASPLRENPVIAAVKNIGSSPVFLVAVIAVTCSLFFNLVQQIINLNKPIDYSSLNRILDEFGIDGLDTNISQYIRFANGSGFLDLIVPAVYVIGLWLIYSAARNRSGNQMSTAGLTTMKVMQIISLVFVCIALAFAVIGCFLIILGVSALNYYASDYRDASAAIAVVIFILLIAVIAGFVLGIIYQIKTISTINTVKNTVLTGAANPKVSVFVAVMNFILAAFNMFSIPSTLLASTSAAPLNLLIIACGITAYICFGIVILKYRSTMTELMPPAAYAAPQFAQTNSGNPYNNQQ